MKSATRMRQAYHQWYAMLRRCDDPKHSSYPNYGGRGITVCARWRESYNNFRDDMGPRPSQKHSIDRIDNDGPYSPENCRWATSIEQNRNRRDNHKLTARGETLCVVEWAERSGKTWHQIRDAVNRGVSAERAIFGP